MNYNTNPALLNRNLLKLYRAMGREEFFGLLGWRASEHYQSYDVVLVPCDPWPTPRDLWNFCQEWNIKLGSIESTYLKQPAWNTKTTWDIRRDPLYQLYIEKET